jgi:hypothetical protein
MSILEVLVGESGVSRAELNALVADLDVESEGPARPLLSTLNNDGAPLQVCLSIGAGGTSARLLADPAIEEPDPCLRFARARAALARCVTGAPFPLPSSASSVERVSGALASALPQEAFQTGALSRGAMWVGVGADRRGLAGYATARWGPAETRWPRALAWLEDMLGSGARARLAHASRVSEVVSVGVEGSPDGRLRAKVYFRLTGKIVLSRLGLEPLAAPSFAAFLASVLADLPVKQTGLVLSVSFDLAAGTLYDAKVDVCGHCVARSGQDWSTRLQALSESLGVGPIRFASPLADGRVELAFVGLGVTTSGRCRLNTYLKDPGQRSRRDDSEARRAREARA